MLPPMQNVNPKYHEFRFKNYLHGMIMIFGCVNSQIFVHGKLD